MDKGSLDNKTIAKLAMAIAHAIKLSNDGEVIGPTTHKILEYLECVDSLPHFTDYRPAGKGAGFFSNLKEKTDG